MQVALNLAAANLPPFSSLIPYPPNCKLPATTSIPSSNKLAASTIGGLRSSSTVKATAAVMYEPETADYNSTFSVFPAEACDTIGGDACLADIYPEVKLQTEGTRTSTITTSELVDRDYLQYNDPKTVLLGEACDVLGGEFCERPYQTGIY